MKAMAPHEIDLERAMDASRTLLGKRIPARLTELNLAMMEIDERHTREPWRLALSIDFVDAVERHCKQLFATLGQDRVPAAAWLARNLLELWVWVRFCGVSRENAWRFHEDALRDAKSMLEAQGQICEFLGFEDEVSGIAAQETGEADSDHLGVGDLGANYLAVAKAATAPGVELGAQFGPLFRSLSRFAHPTAGLIHGIAHQSEACRQIQAMFTTQGAYFADQSLLTLEAQFGLPLLP
jgi:hypothetical protein